MPLEHRRKVFLFLMLLPRVLLGLELREQIRNLTRAFPETQLRLSIIRLRNWGQDYSLAVSDVFEVPIDQVVRTPHPEIRACLQGGVAEEQYFSNLVTEHGWSPRSAKTRQEKTNLLLKQDPALFLSEIQVQSDGSVKVHDGSHRAAIRKELGFRTARVQVTIGLDLT